MSRIRAKCRDPDWQVEDLTVRVELLLDWMPWYKGGLNILVFYLGRTMDPSALFKTNNSIFAPCALLSSSASVGAPSPPSSPITRSCSSPPRLSIDGALLGFNIGENLTSDDLIVPNAASNRIESPDGRAQGMVLRHQRGAGTSEPAGEDDKPWRNCRKTANSAESQNGPTQSQLMTPEFKPTVPQVDLIDFGSIGEFHLI
ncbi:hypothetical protein H4Q26_010163 [Puccinia striiformis f. sp. tritici PST-130]|nr:hypothetical protein H4Q26_010163 [Puccinia striiformis f. sp. tritici PST-130]